MKREEERLVPVRSEDDIMPGALYELRGCVHCGRPHRFIILGRGEVRPCMCQERHAGWLLAGDVEGCIDKRAALEFVGGRFVGAQQVCIKTIPDGALFRVDTGLADEASPYIAAPVPRKSVRT